MRVNFQGNRTFTREELLQVIKIQTPGPVERIFLPQSGTLFQDAILEEDRARLIRFYQQEGFLFVRISPPQIAPHPENGTVEVTFLIQEGNPIRVKDIQFLYHTPNPQVEAHVQTLVEGVRSHLQLTIGSRFRDALVLQDQLLLFQTITNQGYPYLEVNPQLHVQEDSALVTVVWHIRSGPRCVFGPVQITGTERVEPAIIEQQIAFRPGEMYQKDLLEQTQIQIFALGLFEVVDVKAVLDSTRRQEIPVHIHVQEAPRLTARTGVGYGKEDKFRAFLNLVRLGTFGGARRLEFIMKHSDLEPYNLDVKVVQPIFFHYRTSATLNPFLRKEREPGYTVTRLGGKLSIMRRFSQHIRGSINYLYEYVDRANGGASDSASTYSTEEDLYNKAGPILGFTYDSSRPMFNPHGGVFLFINLKTNGWLFPSDYHYLKWVLDVRKYQSVWGAILATRIMLGGILTREPQGEVPVEDRFYSGGITSVRGWGRQQLGPLDARGKPLGGKSIIEGNVEWRVDFWNHFNLVLFLDFGNVWLETGTYPLNELRYSPGIGLGISTPIGPIRLDFARPIFDEKTSWEWHLNVGQSF